MIPFSGSTPLLRACLLLWMLACVTGSLFSQKVNTLSLSEALDQGLKNYQTIQAKRNYFNASSALHQNTKNEYLPNLIASVQQEYGTVNANYGPLGSIGIANAGGGLAVSSSGPILSNQNWNAAFGALYLTTLNWEFFTFGRVRSKINMSGSQAMRDSADLSQEQFVHSVRISGAYLNLLIAQALIRVAHSNLERTSVLLNAVKARAVSGLNAGVDSSLARAELSRAKLAVIDARNNEQQIRNTLAQYLKISPDPFLLDTSYFSRIPLDFNTSSDISSNPQVKYFKSRLDFSDHTASFIQKSIRPGFNFFSVLQTRASGFSYDYVTNQDNFSRNYLNGVNPSRTNYILGVSMSWNVMSIPKIRQQVNAQRFVSAAYQNEYDLISTQLQDQLILADQKIENSLQRVHEVPLQFKAASEAFAQKSVLYKNGLSTIVELQQALYALNRAEVDLNLAFINVWQSLLQKAAASGDFDLFIKQAGN